MQEATQPAEPGCAEEHQLWDGHHILLWWVPEMYRLVCAHLHCVQICPCHAFKGIYHPPKCIHQAKMPWCNQCGFNRHNPGWAGARQSTSRPKTWIGWGSLLHGLKSGGHHALEISSMVGEQRRYIEAQQCSSADWKRKTSSNQKVLGEREGKGHGVSSQMGSLWSPDKNCRAERNLAFCQWGWKHHPRTAPDQWSRSVEDFSSNWCECSDHSYMLLSQKF